MLDRRMQEAGRFHPWASAGHPLVFAHRGGAGLAPENTFAAFERGIAEGVDGVELDVRLSRDGDVVVCHDATLDRTTDATGRVASFTARELAEVDAGYRFSTGHGVWPFRGRGVGVPLLRAVLARFTAHRMIIELKEAELELARAAVAQIREAGAVDRVCIGSFRRVALEEVRRLEPRLATGAASDEVRWAHYRSRVGLFPRCVPYQVLQVPERREGQRIATRRFVNGAHRAAVGVQVWVVDDAAEIQRLLGFGVDGIITDRPYVAVAVVRGWNEQA
jgi:glycerophosphoryl diester phosphodiesterase